MIKSFTEFLNSYGISATENHTLYVCVALFLLSLGCLLIHLIARRLVIPVIEKVVSKSKTELDDIFLGRNVLIKLSHFASLVFVDIVLPVVLEGFQTTLFVLNATILVLIVVFSVSLLTTIIDAVHSIYTRQDVSKEVPIKGFIQLIKLLLYFIATILIISILMDESPLFLLSGIGALSAVILIVFKDALLGLAAGVKLAANKMIRLGDWIEMPKYGADGEVLEITLTTVKIQNWDKTISTIPAYTLISESFKNWRGMQDSGARRMKRSVVLDVQSVSFYQKEDILRLSQIDILSTYLTEKMEEIDAYNQQNVVHQNVNINGRKLTNIGVFRRYIMEYLKRHSKIRKDMTFIIRQLPAEGNGLPIEIYVFINETAWALYEDIQSDIFDHLYAAVPTFGLKIYQAPSGADIREIGIS